MKPVLVLTGPTATGKSAVAMELAKRLQTEIISSDSMQIYRSMDIGTAKVSVEDRKKIKHYCIDIINPDDNFSSFLFKQETLKTINQFDRDNKIPLIVGGTGFYIKNLLWQFDFEGKTTDRDYRGELQSRLEEKGKEALYNELVECDPETAKNLFTNDVKRVMRALEIYYSTGVKKSEGRNNSEPVIKNKIFVLDLPRDILYKRINNRVDEMIKNGLFSEVKSILQSGCKPNAQSMQAIGYKEMVSVINNEISLDRAIDLIKQHSRNYAKRQITYFKKLKADWIDARLPVDQICDSITKAYNSFSLQNS